ncbi:hypothetical protein [Sphingobacterium sp.]|uniref:hypothetical protein n=1 Tax=Sphingobacterium sp. TaxID=341027 RepID=UPI0028AA9F89|nr:hypothetical protein [Sphingobacterium sp.]
MISAKFSDIRNQLMLYRDIHLFSVNIPFRSRDGLYADERFFYEYRQYAWMGKNNISIHTGDSLFITVVRLIVLKESSFQEVKLELFQCVVYWNKNRFLQPFGC